MKNVMLISAMLFAISFSACSQKQPSGDIQKAFNEKFPTAKSVKWDMEEENEWEAEFKMDGTEMSAVFDAKGVWLETEKEISKKQIPEAIKATLDRDYPGYKVEEIEWLETPEQKGYEVKIEMDESDIELLLDETGVVLKKEVINEEDDDEENEIGD